LYHGRIEGRQGEPPPDPAGGQGRGHSRFVISATPPFGPCDGALNPAAICRG